MTAVARYRGPRIRATKSPYQYPYMQYAYQNNGTQLTWRDRPPYQSHAAPSSLSGYLPAPGAPEQIPIQSGYSDYIQLEGCGCGGGCGPKTAMSGVPAIDAIDAAIRPVLSAVGLEAVTTPVVYVGLAGAAFLLYKKLAK